MSQEKINKKIPEIRFKPEGYVSSSSEEFLDEFLEALKTRGFKPEDLIFSGFDGALPVQSESAPEHIFGMNEAGWRGAIKHFVSNPADYAEGWDTPCIGLYDRTDLAEIYSADFPDDYEDAQSRIKLENIVVGERLADLELDVPIKEGLVHKDFPEGSPTDALVGLVYLDR
jgi:hypothetical protein